MTVNTIYRGVQGNSSAQFAIGDAFTTAQNNDDSLNLTKPERVASVAALRLIDKTKIASAETNGYHTAGDGGHGQYWYDSSDTTSADNGFTVIVAADGGRWKLQPVNGGYGIKQAGANGDGVTDNTAALADFFAEISNAELVGDIGGSGTYKFSQLTIPDGVKIRGTSSFKAASGLTGLDISLTVAGAFEAERLHIIGDVAGANYWLVQFDGSNIKIEELHIECEIEHLGAGGTVFKGSNIEIGLLKSKNFGRPFQFSKLTDPYDVQTNIRIGTVDVYGYIRGINFNNCQDWSVGVVKLRVKHSLAAKTPGHNGILVAACKDWEIGDAYAADSGEHGFRIGDAGIYTNETERFSIGRLVTRKTGGCGFKSAPYPSVVRDGSIGELITIDSGLGTAADNSEPFRVTNTDNLYIGSICALANQYTGGKTGILLNSVNNITIDSFYGEQITGRVVRIDETFDSATGNTSNVNINAIQATMTGSPRNAVEFTYSSGGRTIGNVYLRNINVSGFTDYVYEADTALTTTGIIYLSGASPSPAFDSSTPVYVDFLNTTTGRRYVGISSNLVLTGGTSFGDAGAFDAGSAPTNIGAAFFNAGATSSAGAGNIGAAIGFSRAGSTRRGAAIASKQTDATQSHVGLSFMVQSTATSSNEAVYEAMFLKSYGCPNLPAISTYASNAAAISGGLAVGDVYKAATGELRIVV